ncbi:MAG: leucine-rich repeat protein [Eubacterium sp.]|jgi:uncharacterized protein YjdB|nr:leucine-rich repeat protein [Eubacterium sp.]
MYKKWNKRRKIWAIILLFSMFCQNFTVLEDSLTVKAADAKILISADSISAKHANGHGAELAVDGNAGTFWQSIPSGGEGENPTYKYNRMYDHNRYIDIKLDGTYQLSQIKIFNKTDGSFNNYYIYASTDGVNYNKIVSKTSDSLATAEGDSHSVTAEASYLRLNMAYNSASFATNLAEIEVYGVKENDTVTEPAKIEVEDWEGSEWQVEWDKFESDKSYADQKVLTEMSNLVCRVVGDEWKASFRFELRSSLEDGKDIFEIKDGENNTILIRGNSGLAMASGFNYYLKNYVNVDYNPLYGSNTDLKEIKPVGKRIVKEAQFDLRYALNFCTYSYTMSFWNWDEYEEFLDWCAMNGINLVLDIVGQEEVLRQTFKEFNFTDEDVKQYICGPAYFAWFYMQNLYSIGGPLPNSWFEQRTELGRQIHDRMQTYGISPVIQGFAGQAPETFAEKNPGAVLTPTDEWSGFTRPSIIKTYLTEEETAAGKVNYFSDAAEVFYEKQRNVFGDVSHYYAADPFHEGGNTGGLDVGNIYGEVQKEMLKSDPDAIWVMQQWQGNLDANKMSQLDTSKTLPLDLQADMNPQHGLFEENGSPWIYCMLHNFGGRMGLDGEVPVIAADPAETFQQTNNMVGIGMTPEAMENGPVVYELLFDTNWSKDPINYREWMKTYGERRAGGESDSLNRAWKILLNTAYADKGIYYQGAAETVINTRPGDSFNAASTWGHSNILYDKKELDKALLLLIENYTAFSESEAYKYDLADVAEQVICNAAVEYHKLMVQAKNSGNLEEFEKLSTAFLGMIDLSDQILSTTDEFMLGTWVEAARKMITGADDWTKDLFEFNARSLVTTWGGERVGSLKDYSNRKWSGLTETFYKERWEIWVRNRIAELKGLEKDPADERAENNWFLWEYQWANRKSDDENGKYAFETTPSDADLSELAQQAFDKYSYTNLEKNTGGGIQETVNIAKGKPVDVGGSVTASGNPSNLTDGDTSTEWKAEGAGPHTMTIDLEGTYQISGVVISIQQLAKRFPYTWKAEYLNPETSEWTLLDGNENEAEHLMVSTTEISKSFAASKIRLTITTSDVTDSPVYVTEIAVNGEEIEAGETFENLALGIEPTSNQNSSSDSNLSMLTDGNLSTLWKTEGDNYPVNVEIELPQSSYVDNIEVSFEKAGLPFQFKVTAEDGSAQEVLSYTEQSNHGNVLTERSYKIAAQKEIKKVTVTLLSSTHQGSFAGFWPAISEISVMGTPPVTLGNIALGIVPEVKNSKNEVLSDGNTPLSNITDGNPSTLGQPQWNQNNEDYPLSFEFDLKQSVYVDSLELFFEKAGLPFEFKASVITDSDAEEVVSDEYSSHDNVLENASYKINVKKTIKKVIVTLVDQTGRGEAYLAWPALAELIIMGEMQESEEEHANVDFSDHPVSGISVTGGGATNNALDGNRDSTYDIVEQGAEITFEFSDVYYLSHINLVFEKGELGLKYQVYSEDASGNRETVIDMKNATGTLGDKTVKAPVQRDVKKIIFKHLGNNGSGPAWAAELRLYEFEAFGVAKTSKDAVTVTPDAASGLLDGNANYSVAANGAVELTLDKATDLNMVSIQRASDETKALKYKIEYLDFESETENWKLFSDQTENEKEKASVSYAVAEENVFSKKLKITFSEAFNLSGIHVYSTDYAGTLLARITYIEGVLAGLSYDLGYGSYKTEAKTKLEGVLAQAKAAQGVNSLTIDEWLEKVNSAFEEFYDLGAITVERDELLAGMADAIDLMETLKRLGLTSLLEEVMESYQTARTAYEAYKSDQTQIQSAKAALSEGIKETSELAASIEGNPQLLEARTGLCGYLESLKDRKEENYTPETWTVYMAALSAALTILNKADAQTNEITSAKEQLEQAVEDLDLNVENPVESITIKSEDDATSLAVGGTLQLTAEISPANADIKTVDWTSNHEEIASVDENGLVTAHRTGTVIIKADAKDGSKIWDDITLTVTRAPLKVRTITVKSEDDKTELTVGDILQLTAEALPVEADNKEVTWTSSDSKIATVSEHGVVSGIAAGDVKITATAKDGGGAFGEISLKVKSNTSGEPIKVKSITVSSENHKTTLKVSDVLQLIPEVTPSNAENKEVEWSSNKPSVARVDQDGLVTGLSKGSVTITATAKDASGVFGEINLEVEERGEDEPIKVGTIHITAEDNKTELSVGKTLKLEAEALPIEAEDKTVRWKSNKPEIASVDENGVVSGIAEGDVIITATANDGGGASKTIQLTVKADASENPVKAESITVTAEDNKTSLKIGDTVKLFAEVTPAEADQTVAWTSGDSEKATIDETTGLVTAKAAGEVELIATAKDGSGATGKIKLNIEDGGSQTPVKAESILVTAKDNKTSLKAGENLQLSAAVTPAEAKQDVTWSSSDPSKAEVDQNGLVKAKAAGAVKIIATAQDESGVTGEITLKITANSSGGNQTILVSSISLKALKTKLTVGGAVQITASVLPANAKNKELTWVSKNSKIASVSAKGLVTAKAAGVVEITATAKDGSRKSGSIKITVENPQPAKPPVWKPGTERSVSDAKYVVIQSSGSEKTVAFKGPKKKNKKTVTVPPTVKIGEDVYKVTEIAKDAFKNNSKVKTVIIGKNVTKISKNAFNKCKKLKTIKIQSTALKNVEKNAFKNINKKATITVPKKKYKKYKNMFKKAKLAKSIKIKKK